MPRKFFAFIFVLYLMTNCLCVNGATSSDLKISNNYFSFVMPKETEGTYSVDKNENGIFICEKYSAKTRMGGFAFGIKIFKYPRDYANIPGSKKLGELEDKKGALYDVVLMRPSEIQYEDGEEIQKNYNRLYDFGNNIEIKGINGNKYVKNRGMKGKDLYHDTIKKYKQDMTNKTLFNKIGYFYYDVNSDGIDELFIGDTNNIYDVFAMVDRKPVHIISKGDADRFYICNDAFLCGQYSLNKKEKTMTAYFLENNSKDVHPQITLIYDTTKNKKQPWFVIYGNSRNLENISKKNFKEIKVLYDKREKFDLSPLNQFE